jgi:heat-inducible transcriptional repressor
VTLKPRQELILRAVVEEYIASGLPVGSRYLRDTCDFGVASSTIRGDLADLEEEGFLAHPHTSAGRVPTDAGYRYYVNGIIREQRERREYRPAWAVDRDTARAELDEALRETAEALSRVTELLAVVSAPPLASTIVRHVEVLLLRPRLVMVVVITSSGSVSKRMFRFTDPVDEGLIEFARAYLNERLGGAQLGSRLIESAFASQDLRGREREFLRVLQPAFRLDETLDLERLHLGGAPRLVEALAAQGVPNLEGLLDMLEERINLLELLYEALRQDDVYLRIGHEMTTPSLQSCSLVAASYGVANRHLGAVSVLGPTRMDYQRVISAVRASADDLSELLEEIW